VETLTNEVLLYDLVRGIPEVLVVAWHALDGEVRTEHRLARRELHVAFVGTVWAVGFAQAGEKKV
jgi:hypothetical protein